MLSIQINYSYSLIEKYTEFYFHICGGNHLNITRADTHLLWKDVPEVTSPDNTHHTIQCAEVTKLTLLKQAIYAYILLLGVSVSEPHICSFGGSSSVTCNTFKYFMIA